MDHVKSNAFRNNSHFVYTNEQKAAGPDGISPRVLRMCSSQLCELFCTIFNLSFLCGVAPDIWKSSCIVPFSKNNKVGSMNDLRPVALTSVNLKTCERIVLPQLKSFIHDSLDPFMYSYQHNRSCEVDLLVAIGEVTSHLDSRLSVEKNKVNEIIAISRNSVGMMFFIFSQLSTPFSRTCWPTECYLCRSQVT